MHSGWSEGKLTTTMRNDKIEGEGNGGVCMLGVAIGTMMPVFSRVFLGFAVIVLIIWFIGYIVFTYNSFVGLRHKVKNAWAQIDVQLKRRVDLIPNLVEVVKGYASHEKETFEKVVTARNLAANATSVEDKIAANNQLTGALKTLFAVSEAYPELKANTNFIELQEALTKTEDKIMFARQFYTDTVTMYNVKIERFPANIIARIFNFVEQPVFEVTANERDVPQVQF